MVLQQEGVYKDGLGREKFCIRVLGLLILFFQNDSRIVLQTFVIVFDYRMLGNCFVSSSFVL